MYSYDIKENTLEDIKVEEGWHNFMPHPTEEKIAFSQTSNYIDGQLFIYNLETKKTQPLSPRMENASYLKWDNTGKNLVARLIKNKIAVIEITD
jgi:Tol biopolymer transport system component